MTNAQIALLAAVLTSLKQDSGQVVSYAAPAKSEDNVLGVANTYLDWLKKHKNA